VGLGFGDAGLEVVEDLGEAATLVRVGAQQGATQATVFVDAGCVIGTAAVAEGDFAAFEVAEELGPFLVTGGAVFLTGTQFAAARARSGERSERCGRAALMRATPRG